jgi:hypothetical protein
MKATVLKEKAINMLDSLPEDKLESAIDYLKYLQGDFDCFDVNRNIITSLVKSVAPSLYFP